LTLARLLPIAFPAVLLLGACGGAGVAADPGPTPGLGLTDATLDLPSVGSFTVAEASVDVEGKGKARTVHASLQSPGAPELVIEAPSSEWDLAAGSVLFTGGVVVNRGDVQLHCRTLALRFDGDHRVELAEATGEVRLDRGSLHAQAEAATLVGATGRLELHGAAKLQEPAGTLVGARIVLWLDDDRVECADCRLVVDGSKLLHGDR
jgi:lipopolysaccharide transport protein LptA